MLERRRASQRQVETSAGETAEEILERLQDELNTTTTTTAAPKAMAQGSEFLRVSGASTSTVVGGAQAGALVEGPAVSKLQIYDTLLVPRLHLVLYGCSARR